MPLPYEISSLENVDEKARGFYKQGPTEGKFVLDVDGVMPKTQYDTDVAGLKQIAYAEDGKTYQEMFNGSQNALKAARTERDGFETELKTWKKLGEYGEVSGWKDKLDQFQANGQKLTEQQQTITQLQADKRKLEAQVNGLNNEKAALATERDSLATYKADAERRIDRADAEERIAKVVETLPEANQKALKRHLFDRYTDKTLVRKENGELVTSDGIPLLDYAKETMEAYGLVKRTVPSVNGEPGQKGAEPQGGGSAYSQIAALLH